MTSKLPRRLLARICVLALACLVMGSATTASAQPLTINHAPDFGTHSVGEIQFSLSASGGTGAYTWEIVTGSLPPGIALRTDIPSWFPPGSSAGLIGIATTPGNYPFTLRVTSGAEQVTLDVTTFRITAFTTSDPGQLPDAFVGSFYTYTLTPQNAGGAVTWTLTSGALPSGVTLAGATGVISGTPDPGTQGFYNVGLSATDGVETIFRWVNIRVGTVHITTDVLPNALQNAPYGPAVIAAIGGTAPYTFTMNGCCLPFGLTLDAAGSISGSANTGPGRYQFSVRVTDALGATHDRNLLIFVGSDPPQLPTVQVHGGTFEDCTIGAYCSRGLFTGGGGGAPYGWSATGLPPGMTLATAPGVMSPWMPAGDAELIGVPTAAGLYTVQVTVTANDGTSVTQSFPLRVSTLALRSDFQSGTIGAPYARSVRVIGGTGPYSATIVDGQPPAGTAFNPATLEISGTPSESGGFRLLYQITDSLGATLTSSDHLSIDGAGANTVQINEYWDLGHQTTGSFFSRQLNACCAPGAIAWSLDGGVLPPGVSISATGLLSGNVSAAGTYTFLLRAADQGTPANYAVRQFRLVVTPLSLTVNTQLPDGFVGSGYSPALTVSGAVGAVTWTLSPFDYLPPGIALTQNAGAWSLSGTPTASGRYSFNLKVTDSAGNSLVRWFSVSIYPAGVTPPIGGISCPAGVWSIGDIEMSLSAFGGNGTYAWSVVAGALPQGLSLRVPPDLAPWFPSNASAGLIGVATSPDTYNFTLRVTSGSQQRDQSCTITITALTPADDFSLPDAFVGRPYSHQLTAIGGAGPLTWTANGPLPAGLSLSSTGLLSGTPADDGFFGINYTVSDGVHAVGRSRSLGVFAIRIDTPGELPNATQGASYSATVVASGGTAPYTFTVNGGMPSGLSLDPVTGVIAGTVNAGAHNYGFDVSVVDANQVSYTRRMAINVTGVPPRLPSIQPFSYGGNDCTFGVPCSRGIQVSNGGTAPYAWTATGLPAGLSIRWGSGNTRKFITPGDAEIFGVPTELGLFAVSVTVTDAQGVSATHVLPLRVSPMMVREGFFPGTINQAYSQRIRVIGGTLPYSAATGPGRLPAGLSFDAGTFTVSGTPLENGGFNQTIVVTDAGGRTLTANQFVQIGGGTSTVNISHNGDLGTAVIGQPYSTQLNACCVPTPPPSFTWSVTGGSLPPGLSLSPSGLLSGTISAGSAPGAVTFLVRAADAANAANAGVRQFTLRLTNLTITTNSLPVGNVGSDFGGASGVQLAATGGTGALTWSLASGSALPPGLTLSSAGVLSGTPAGPGQFSFSVSVADEAGSLTSRSFNVSIYPAGVYPPLSLSIGSTQTTRVGTFTIAIPPSSVSGGLGPYSISMTPGAPAIPGMHLRTSAPFPTFVAPDALAAFTGVLTAPGTYTTSIRVSDSAPTPATFDRPITIVVTPLNILSQGTLPRATKNALASYDFTFQPYGGSGNYSWSATNLPPGFSIDSATGQLTGFTSASGTFSPNVTLTDLAGGSTTVGFTLGVDPFAIETNGILPQGTANVNYSVTFSAPGCGAPCTWTGIRIPFGLSLSSAGLLSGSVGGPLSATFQVTAAGPNGTVTKSFSLLVSSPAFPLLTITTPSALNDVTVGNSASQLLSAQGGAAPYTWTLESGALPLGVSLVADGATQSANFAAGMSYLSGRALYVDTYPFTLRVTDSSGAWTTRTFTWKVSPLSLQTSNLPLSGSSLVLDQPYTQALLTIGGSGSYPSWTNLGTMPPGLALSGGTGVVSGTPANTGSFSTSVRVEDSDGNAITTGLNVNIAGPTAIPVFIQGGPTFTAQEGFQATLTVTPSGLGTTAPITMTALTPLPPGMALLSGAEAVVGGAGAGQWVVTGVPIAGTYTFTLRAQDSAPTPNAGVRTLTLVVTPQISTNTSLPDASVGAPYSVPLLSLSSAGGAQTWSLAIGSATPPGLTLSAAGVLGGTPTQAGDFSLAVVVTSGPGVATQRTFSLRVSPIAITDADLLPAAIVGTPYTHTFTAAGGGAAIWSATGVPAGMTFSAAGVLSGTPLNAAQFALQVTATDGGVPVMRRFLLPVRLPNASVLDIPAQTAALGDATVGQSVSFNLNANGGVPPYMWSCDACGMLPPGLELRTGAVLTTSAPYATVLSGIPTTAGTYSFELIATDQNGAQSRRTFALRVSPIGIVGNQPPNATAGVAYSVRFEAVGGTGPHTFTTSPLSLTQDMLPTGFTLSSAGVLSGTTTSTGNYAFRLHVTDSLGSIYARNVTLVVNGAGGLRVTSTNPPDGSIGAGRRFVNLATNGTSTYSWSVVAGGLAPGVSLVTGLSGPNTTALAGAPSTAGTYAFTLRATDTANASIFADHAFTHRVGTQQVVAPAVQIASTLDLPAARVGVPYSFAFKVAGGTAPYTFAESPFNPLPAGLSLSADGVLSGTPAPGSNGAYGVLPIVTDALGQTQNMIATTLIVAPAAGAVPLVRAGSTFAADASVGVPYAFALDPILRGGTAPFAWTVSPTPAGNALPPGMALFHGSNGVSTYLGGTPTAAGTHVFALDVADASTPAQTLTITFTLRVSPIALSPELLPNGTVGTIYPTQSLTPSGGIAPYVVAFSTNSDRPPGLSLGGGALSGTPTTAGAFFVQVSVTDAAGNALMRTYRVVVDNAAGEAPALSVSPRPVQVYHELGSPAPAAVPIAVNTTTGAVPFSIAHTGVPGATLAAAGGTTSTSVALNFDVSSLGVGTYAGLVAVNAPGAVNAHDAVPVTLTIAPAPPCTYAVNPSSSSVPGDVDNVNGVTRSFAVTTGGNCGWTAVASESWITIVSGGSGPGGATPTYKVDQDNTSPSPRTATITINGAVHTVTQFGTACSFTIAPAGVNATWVGGSADVTVNASHPSCAWTASSATLGLSTTNGTGTAIVSVSVPSFPTGGTRQLTATIAGQTFTVNQTGVDCIVALSPYSASAPATGTVAERTGSVAITTPAGCGYSTVLGPSWISVTSGETGTGSGTLVYVVEPNSTTTPRTGTLTIGGQAFQITQEPLPCSLTVDTSPLATPYASGGGVRTVAITTNGANCAWTASSGVSWATVSPASGTGNATIGISVTSNAASATPRDGSLTIGGQPVSITQSGITCTYQLESASASAPASGGGGSVRVIAPAACAWSSSSNAGWITITSSGTAGTSAVQFSAAANPSATPRSGTLTIAGLPYTVNQAGAPCSYTIAAPATSPLLAAEGVAAQSFTFTAAFGGCTPTAVSFAGWINVDGMTFDGSSGTVTYSVQQNGYGANRSGTIQVGNATFTVAQSGATCAFSLSDYGKVFYSAGGSATLHGSPTALGCVPAVGTDQPSFILLDPLTGPVLNIFSLPYTVAPFPVSLTTGVRFGTISFGGQILTIKQFSW